MEKFTLKEDQSKEIDNIPPPPHPPSCMLLNEEKYFYFIPKWLVEKLEFPMRNQNCSRAKHKGSEVYFLTQLTFFPAPMLATEWITISLIKINYICTFKIHIYHVFIRSSSSWRNLESSK